ncbi:MAG: hypothetical protein QNK23_04690 [Crocinitomicaceae bacterium]|nr:hypothetical protein [Crocinitomicaceae bacterium]
MNKKNLLRISGLLIMVIFLSIGCRKKLDTIAIVVVKDHDNIAVQGAIVTVFGSGTAGEVTVNEEATTNSNGEVTFNFNNEYQLGQAGFAILDISVEKDSEIATGIIKVEPETTTLETVFIGV